MFAASKSGSVDAKDPQFNYVTMLLHGDGTNGAQNNTFLDSSTNAFSITRNGNTTQGTFTPYGSNWSNYFNANYLSIANNTGFDFGSGDFTIEAWAYFSLFSNSGNGNVVVSKGASGSVGADFYSLQANSSGVIQFYFGSGSPLITGSTLSANTWYHLAVTRSGSTFTLWVNGSSAGTGTSSATLSTGGPLIIASQSYSVGAVDRSLYGYASNLRLVKGTAVYTSTFTPSTTPLTAISGTTVLTCQSNRFIDNSSNAFAITIGGSPSVQRFSPFSPTTAYSTSVIGGSGYFDGTGDYLTLSNSTAFTFGTGDFTIEMWIYATSIGTYNNLFFTGDNSTGQANLRLNSGKAEFFANDSSPFILTGSTTLTANTWYHIAFSRSGSTNKIFLNGVQDATGTNSYSYSGTGSVQIGAWSANNPNFQFAGYMSNTRVVKGTAVYTTAFTPPTAPLTAITNTSLLLNYTNAGILDNAMMNDLETVGNAQISTSVKKYGTGSMYFDGTDDRLNMPSSPNLAFGSGDFTLEMWAYFTSVASFPTLTDSRSSTGSTAGFNLGLSTAKVQLYTTSQLLIGSSTLSTNTWYHIAVTRASGTLKIWLNGVQDATVSNSTNWSDQTFVVGATPSAANFMTGYIDDLRITKGVARYTATFTAPTTAFADKG